MRVLWVFPELTCQQREFAKAVASAPDVSLDIMCPFEHEPPLDSSVAAMEHVFCRNKLDFAARRKIRARLQRGNYDIVHAYTARNFANTIGACRGVNPRPRIVGYRGTIDTLRTLDPGHWLTHWHPAVSKIVCVCEATRQALLDSNIRAERLVTVHEGCLPEALATPPRAELAQFDIPEDAIVVGTVANMRRVKGVDLLVRAARELADLPNVYWLLIGGVWDPLVEELARDPAIADRIRLPGSVPEGGRFAGLFDIYVAPSRKEGLSMAIMEAMAQRTCPVVTNVGGSPELIRDRVDGLVVPPEDPAALAGALRTLIGDAGLRKQLADSAYNRVTNQFSIAAWAQRQCEVYRDLVPAAATRAA